MTSRSRIAQSLLVSGAMGFSLAAQQVAAAEGGVIEEITVTAQKKTELLKDVPASIAVLSGDGLLSQGADKLEDYVQRVPGLVMRAGTVGQQQLTIRGISTGPGGGSTVAIYLDDAPFGAGVGLLTPDVDSIDLSRIEVLRGPQGTLYGASNIGGLVSYVTVEPDTKRLNFTTAIDAINAAHGEWGYSARGRINAPLAEDKAALVVSAYKRQDPGFIDDAGRGLKDLDQIDTTGGRATLLLTPTDAMSIKLTAIGQNREADGFAQEDADPPALTPRYGDYQQRRAPGSEFFETRNRLYYATINYDFGWADLTNTLSYNTTDTESSQDYTLAFAGSLTGTTGYKARYGISQDKIANETRLSGTLGEKLEWLAGVYYTEEEGETLVGIPEFDLATGAVLGAPLLDSDTDAKYRELAGFTQFTYHFTPRFELTLGGRYAENRQDSVSTSSGALVGPMTVAKGKSDDSVGTFTVAPSYALTDALTVYARAASGYRPGGANAGNPEHPDFGPDRVKNYEAGLKGAFDSGISFEVAAFAVEWTDIQLQVFADNGLRFTDNAGEASSRGVEANAAWTPLDGLTLSATAAYIDAQLDRDLPAGDIFGREGDPLPYSPKWKASVTADYDKPIGSSWSAFVGGGFHHNGSVVGIFQGTATVAREHLDDYNTVDLRLGGRNEHLTIALIGQNIFDKRAYNGVSELVFDPTGPRAMEIIQPRTVSLSFRYDY